MATVPITVSVEAAGVLRRFAALPERSRARIRRNVARELIALRGEVRARSDVRFRSGARGLFGRLTSHADSDSRLNLDAAIGFRKTRGFPYELSQEFGARAKPGGAMTIPVSSMARRVQGGARHFPGGTLFRPKGTNVLAEQAGRGKLQVHYVLVKSIRPRLNFRRTVGSNSVADRISAAILGGMEGAA